MKQTATRIGSSRHFPCIPAPVFMKSKIRIGAPTQFRKFRQLPNQLLLHQPYLLLQQPQTGFLHPAIQGIQISYRHQPLTAFVELRAWLLFNSLISWWGWKKLEDGMEVWNTNAVNKHPSFVWNLCLPQYGVTQGYTVPFLVWLSNLKPHPCYS